jgi:hypothetical protein
MLAKLGFIEEFESLRVLFLQENDMADKKFLVAKRDTFDASDNRFVD